MQLHQRGVDLLVDVLDAADRVGQLSPEEIRELLKKVAQVMGQILERDAAVALNGGERRFGKQARKPTTDIISIPADKHEPVVPSIFKG